MPAPERVAAYRLDLATAIAERTGYDVELVDEVILATFEEIAGRLAAESQVVLRGFGVFEARRMQPVKRAKPSTGEPVLVPSKLRARFRPSAPLTARLNEEPS